MLITVSRNLIYTKQFVWFGSDAFATSALGHYLKTEKSADAAHHTASWAAETGKGLLFFGDKAAPTGVVNLVRITPEADSSGSLAPVASSSC
jgi:hypothetical protein